MTIPPKNAGLADSKTKGEIEGAEKVSALQGPGSLTARERGANRF